MNTIIQNSKFKIYNLNAILCIICYSLLVVSCSQPTEDDQVTFSGTVTLEDTTDYSGVTVSLYAPVELDTALVRINEEYPNIGVQISQETEFDHREHEPLYTATTKADGSWEIKAPKGEYNLVAEKEGWGWRYDLKLTSAANLKNTLFKIQILKGEISNNLTLKENHFYKLEGYVTFNSGFAFKAEKNTVILAAENSKLIISGSFTCPDDGTFLITGEQNITGYWKGIELNYPGNILKNLQIKNSYNAVRINVNNIEILSTYINNVNDVGVIINNDKKNIHLINCLIANTNGALDLFTIDTSVTINSCIIINSRTTGIALNHASPKITNNYIYKNSIGIDCLFDSDAIIKNNNIKKSDLYGIQIGGSNPEITYNNFADNTENSIRIPPTGYAHSSIPKINYNNFNASKFHVVLIGNSANANKYDIDSKYNWWGTLGLQNIQQLIYDKSDIDTDSDEYNNTGFVVFQPYEMHQISNAGIKK